MKCGADVAVIGVPPQATPDQRQHAPLGGNPDLPHPVLEPGRLEPDQQTGTDEPTLRRHATQLDNDARSDQGDLRRPHRRERLRRRWQLGRRRRECRPVDAQPDGAQRCSSQRPADALPLRARRQRQKHDQGASQQGSGRAHRTSIELSQAPAGNSDARSQATLTAARTAVAQPDARRHRLRRNAVASHPARTLPPSAVLRWPSLTGPDVRRKIRVRNAAHRARRSRAC